MIINSRDVAFENLPAKLEKFYSSFYSNAANYSKAVKFQKEASFGPFHDGYQANRLFHFKENDKYTTFIDAWLECESKEGYLDLETVKAHLKTYSFIPCQDPECDEWEKIEPSLSSFQKLERIAHDFFKEKLNIPLTMSVESKEDLKTYNYKGFEATWRRYKTSKIIQLKGFAADFVKQTETDLDHLEVASTSPIEHSPHALGQTWQRSFLIQYAPQDMIIINQYLNCKYVQGCLDPKTKHIDLEARLETVCQRGWHIKTIPVPQRAFEKIRKITEELCLSKNVPLNLQNHSI